MGFASIDLSVFQACSRLRNAVFVSCIEFPVRFSVWGFHILGDLEEFPDGVLPERVLLLLGVEKCQRRSFRLR